VTAKRDAAPNPDDHASDAAPPKRKHAKKPNSSDQETGLPTYVTDLASIELQVGTHVIRALAHDGAVAVLSLVQPSPGGGQRIASIPLDEGMLEQVQEIVFASNEKPEGANAGEVPCVGFHCYLPSNLAKNRVKDKKKE
jgi:hypothetical protein